MSCSPTEENNETTKGVIEMIDGNRVYEVTMEFDENCDGKLDTFFVVADSWESALKAALTKTHSLVQIKYLGSAIISVDKSA
jgi:hypothetical protein